ncbi:hypothetical protein ABZ801_00815 [Actinomadura sp. NPDC047616]|uniref:hypothetical protein n=1 Tax=Actinomadura sp. NPDC047616 TaxID=3155914 RepID=UPI0033E6E5B9
MRMSAAKFAGVLVVGGALLSTTACGLVGGEKKAACDNIESELKSLTSGGAPATSGSAAASSAQKWSDAAAKIRAEGQKAGGDVESAATRFAGDLDSTATMLRNLSSGNLSGARPNTSSMMQNAQDLGKACGFANTGFRFG